MMALSYAAALGEHPDLVGKVLNKLAQSISDVNPAEVSWYLVACHDDPAQLLDEAAIADVMLTGKMPCRVGICGKLAGHHGCSCHLDWVEPGQLH